MADSLTVPPNPYKNLRLTDPNEPVWVAPVDSYEEGVEQAKKERQPQGSYNGRYFILMGPTGSGKSSFIEAIASKSTKKPLGIAKDQLESVTQEPHIYAVKNLVVDNSSVIYLIDTPGFADPRISELQVLDKVTFWRDRCQDVGYARILYFHPISDIRMPASRKRCLSMVQNFWGVRLSRRAMLVTSMWDRIPERSRNAAEQRFSQLSTNHWGDWINEGSLAEKFENTFESAMSILDAMCDTRISCDGYPTVSGLGGIDISSSPVYEALFDRISYLEQQRIMINEDLQRPSSQEETELVRILTHDLAKTEVLLQQFRAQMEILLRRANLLEENQSTSSTKPGTHTRRVILPASQSSVPVATTASRPPLPIPLDVPAIQSVAPTVNALPKLDAAMSAPAVKSVLSNTVELPPSGVPSSETTTPEQSTSVESQSDRVLSPGKSNRTGISMFPKRISQWVDKKVDKMHLRGSHRKGE